MVSRIARAARFSQTVGMRKRAAPGTINRQRIADAALRIADGSRYPRVATAASAFEEWTFLGVFDVGLCSLIAGIEERGLSRSPRVG